MTFLSGWSNRKSKIINGSTAGAQSNYQLRITIHKGSGIDGNTDIYCNNKCKSDFSDIRFTKSNGATLLNYFIETTVVGTSAVMWVKVDTIPASPSSVIIYIYYNNPTATSLSNGVNTFIQFLNFENTNEGFAVDNASLDQAKYDSYSLKRVTAGDDFKALSYTTRPFSISFYFFDTNINTLQGLFIALDNNKRFGFYVSGNSPGKYQYYDTSFHTLANVTQNVWERLEIIIHSDNTWDASINNVLFPNLNNEAVVQGNQYNFYNGGTTYYIDGVFQRLLSSPEPAFGVTGSEEGLSIPYLGSIFSPIGRGITPSIGSILGRKRTKNKD